MWERKDEHPTAIRGLVKTIVESRVGTIERRLDAKLARIEKLAAEMETWVQLIGLNMPVDPPMRGDADYPDGDDAARASQRLVLRSGLRRVASPASQSSTVDRDVADQTQDAPSVAEASTRLLEVLGDVD